MSGTEQKKELAIFAFAALTVILVGLAAFAPLFSIYSALVLALLFIILRASDRTKLFIIGLLFPFQGLRLTLPRFEEQFLISIFPDGIDLSIGYIISLVLIAIVVLRFFADLISRRRPRFHLPLLGAAALFWLSAILSALNAGDEVVLSIKYAFYPIAFSYLAYAILPSALARDREELFGLVYGMVFSGALVALMGALSFVTGEGFALGRVTPIQIFGVWPIGSNHNLLAETLVATAPLALVLGEKHHSRRRFLLRMLALFMVIIALLTFARTAWIAFGTMAVLALILEYRREFARYKPQMIFAGAVLLPLFAALVIFSGTREVQCSTASRLAMTNYSLYLFSSHPLIGAGAGTFVSRLGQAKDFLMDFGDPLDAHGFGQKILSEQGIVGLVFFIFFLGRIVQTLVAAVKTLPLGSAERRTMLLFSLGALGLIFYEMFNTTYYSAKMWLPIGAAFAALPYYSKLRPPLF